MTHHHNHTTHTYKKHIHQYVDTLHEANFLFPSICTHTHHHHHYHLQHIINIDTPFNLNVIVWMCGWTDIQTDGRTDGHAGGHVCANVLRIAGDGCSVQTLESCHCLNYMRNVRE